MSDSTQDETTHDELVTEYSFDYVEWEGETQSFCPQRESTSGHPCPGCCGTFSGLESVNRVFEGGVDYWSTMPQPV